MNNTKHKSVKPYAIIIMKDSVKAFYRMEKRKIDMGEEVIVRKKDYLNLAMSIDYCDDFLKKGF